MRTKEEEIERIDSLIERTANWLIQGRDGDDTEGAESAWLYIRQLKEQKKKLQEND